MRSALGSFQTRELGRRPRSGSGRSIQQAAGGSSPHLRRVEWRNVDDAVIHDGMEEPGLAPIPEVDVVKHPTQLTRANQAAVDRWHRRVLLDQLKVSGEFAAAQIWARVTQAGTGAAIELVQMLPLVLLA